MSNRVLLMHTTRTNSNTLFFYNKHYPRSSLLKYSIMISMCKLDRKIISHMLVSHQDFEIFWFRRMWELFDGAPSKKFSSKTPHEYMSYLYWQLRLTWEWDNEKEYNWSRMSQSRESSIKSNLFLWSIIIASELIRIDTFCVNTSKRFTYIVYYFKTVSVV